RRADDEPGRCLVLRQEPDHWNAAGRRFVHDSAGATGLWRLAVPYRDQDVDLPQHEAAGFDVTLLARAGRSGKLSDDCSLGETLEKLVTDIPAVSGGRGHEVLQ